MKQTFRYLLLLAVVLFRTTHSFGQSGQKYPYVKSGEDGNGPVIVSRDDMGGVATEALTGDVGHTIEALLQVKPIDEESENTDTFSWQDAQKACTLGWRLPTKRELQLIWLMGGAGANDINETNSLYSYKGDFGNLTTDEYWTSTADGWYVSFEDGKTASDVTTNRKVRCVKAEENALYPPIPSGTFAHSNIVLIEDKLVFATRREETENHDKGIYTTATIPANSQGVHFRFGSLVAVSSTGKHNTSGWSSSYVAYCPPEYNNNNPPTDWIFHDTDTSINNVPFINTNWGTNSDYTKDHMLISYPEKGYSASQGKGDICRYISYMGWVEGKWRLPTAQEIRDYTEHLHNGKKGKVGGSFEDVLINNADGLQQIPSGRWFGPENDVAVNINNMATPPNDNVRFFPAGGYRYYNSGVLYNPGQHGHSWSSTISANSAAFFLDFSIAAYTSPFGGTRANGRTVRCIAE